MNNSMRMCDFKIVLKFLYELSKSFNSFCLMKYKTSSVIQESYRLDF